MIRIFFLSFFFLAHLSLKRLRKEHRRPDAENKKKKFPPPPAYHFQKQLQKHALVFPGADSTVIHQSQRITGSEECKAHLFVGMDSYMTVVALMFIGLVVWLAAHIRFVERLVERYPRVATAGLFTHEPPREELLKQTMILRFFGQDAAGRQVSDNQISLPDPGYGGTSILVTSCAFSLLHADNNSTRKSGALTPSTAFDLDDLQKRLANRGITWT